MNVKRCYFEANTVYTIKTYFDRSEYYRILHLWGCLWRGPFVLSTDTQNTLHKRHTYLVVLETGVLGEAVELGLVGLEAAGREAGEQQKCSNKNYTHSSKMIICE